MYGPYAADPGRANRLHAARKAANFKSARAAALNFGWAEATYRAHETATGYFDDKIARSYAAAFKVNSDWLINGAGKGPATDPVREARFKARIKAAPDRPKDGPPLPARRLRLIRRLAGFTSVAEAAIRLDLTRSTLSAHEVGQNEITPEIARLYAAALHCNADWLLTGALPSGLPAIVEGQIDALLALHSDREANVQSVFNALRTAAPDRPAPEPIRYPRSRGERSSESQDVVREYTSLALFEALKSGADQLPPFSSGREFSFPAGFLSEVLHCGPATAVIVAPSADGHPGGRALVDTAFRVPNPSEDYILVRADGQIVVAPGDDRRIPDGRQRSEWTIVGKVCAVFERFLRDSYRPR